MIYTAVCPRCKKVVAISKDFGIVKSWLDSGLSVSKRDFTDEDPLIVRECKFCK